MSLRLFSFAKAIRIYLKEIFANKIKYSILINKKYD